MNNDNDFVFGQFSVTSIVLLLTGPLLLSPRFVAIEQLQKNNEDSVRVLLSSDRVYFLGHHEPIGFRGTDHYNIMLDVPYNKLYQCRAIPYGETHLLSPS